FSTSRRIPAIIRRLCAGRGFAVGKMSSSVVAVRCMQPADIGAVLEIQARCYTEVVNESAESFLAKLEVAPEGCFVAQAQGRALGYLVSLPIAFSRPPALDARQLSVPGDVDCLYLHDLAVAPEARGSGAGGVLVRRFMQRARQAGFRR